MTNIEGIRLNFGFLLLFEREYTLSKEFDKKNKIVIKVTVLDIIVHYKEQKRRDSNEILSKS